MRISDWSSDVCSSDLIPAPRSAVSPDAIQSPAATILFWVSVPVLSVQRTVAAPMDSIADARRVSTPTCAIRQAPIAMKIARTTGNSSGRSDIPIAMPASNASSHPAHEPVEENHQGSDRDATSRADAHDPAHLMLQPGRFGLDAGYRSANLADAAAGTSSRHAGEASTASDDRTAKDIRKIVHPRIMRARVLLESAALAARKGVRSGKGG